jgi:hypothetical protein
MNLPVIQGREAVPVRLIPIITHGRLGPESLTGILANGMNIGGWHYPSDSDEIEVDVYDEESDAIELTKKTRAELIGPQARDNGVVAYHLNDGKTPVKMWVSEWVVIYREIKLLEPVLREQEKKIGVYQSMESVWRLKATKVLPPGVFLWREDMDILWKGHTDYYARTQYDPPDFRKGVNYNANIRPEYRILVWEGFEHLRSLTADGRKANGLLECESARRIHIGYSDFVRLCRVDDPAHWVRWLSIRPEGVWISPPPDDTNLEPTERALWYEHPEKDVTKPLLTFPCSLLQLQDFLESAGVYGCIDPFDMAEFVLKELKEPVGLSAEPPPYLAPTHPFYSTELATAIGAWEHATQNFKEGRGKTFRRFMEFYVSEKLIRSGFDTEGAKKRIPEVANADRFKKHVKKQGG